MDTRPPPSPTSASASASPRDNRASSHPPPTSTTTTASAAANSNRQHRFNIRKEKRIDLQQFKEPDETFEDGSAAAAAERRKSSGDPATPGLDGGGSSSRRGSGVAASHEVLNTSSNSPVFSPHAAAGNVLKKAASISLEERSPGVFKHYLLLFNCLIRSFDLVECKKIPSKPRFSLEHRSDFSEMEKFEGRLFTSWISANLSQDNYLKIMLTEQVHFP